MKNAVTVLFELNWSNREVGTSAAFQGLREAAVLYDPAYEVLNQQTRYVFVLDVPAQQHVLACLLHWCEVGGYSYKARWFANELT